jgi:starch-binding outer membrane protein, SusD/RagB family
MKKENFLKMAALLVVCSIMVNSCQKNVLNKPPLDSYNDANVWSSIPLAQAYASRLYIAMPNFKLDFWSNDRNGSYALSAICDESYNQYNLLNSNDWNTGTVNPGTNDGKMDSWFPMFSFIQIANTFFGNIDKVPSTGPSDEAAIAKMKGETYYLRAFCYATLAMKYGGLPLISKAFDVNSNFDVPRSDFPATVAFIVADLDKAASLLPLSFSGADLGRVTKGSALALKSRILLLAASPQWNTANNMGLWQAASDAAKAVIDLNAYSLSPKYADIFRNDLNNPEIITQHLTYGGTEWGGGGSQIYPERYQSPGGFQGWASYTPSQNLVDAYNTVDGKMITDPTSNYDPQNPYANRDPRLFATVLYDGVPFLAPEFCKSRYDAGATNVVEFWQGGYDSPTGAGGSGETKTGYTFKKYIDTTYDWQGGKPSPGKSWVVSRLGEIYLNYAEAEFNLGRTAVAAEYINKLRTRAGITATLAASDITLPRIQNERQVELAFEGFRFFDVRRWKIADVTENAPLRGVVITKTGNKKSYEYKTVQERSFKESMYLFPIPQNEIQRSSLQQNPLY